MAQSVKVLYPNFLLYQLFLDSLLIHASPRANLTEIIAKVKNLTFIPSGRIIIVNELNFLVKTALFMFFNVKSAFTKTKLEF